MPISSGNTLLNKYRIVKLLGEGGMARVWLAEELAFGQRLVAIKEPRPNPLSDDAAEIELRYRREVHVCAELEHASVPNIVRAITAEPTDDGLLLVMTYMPGGDLAEVIRQHPAGLPIERAVAIALDVLAALAGAHSHPLEIVHRDIKPSNILFNAQGRAYLADFGLAQLANMSIGRSQLAGRSHPGSPIYMAPEQEQSSGYLSPAADIFALGCVLWEMLTGKRYKRFKSGTSPSRVRSELPSWLDEVLAKALAEEPWDRWQEAEDMATALAEALEEAARRQAELEARQRAEAEAEHRRQQQAAALRAAEEQARREAEERARQEIQRQEQEAAEAARQAELKKQREAEEAKRRAKEAGRLYKQGKEQLRQRSFERAIAVLGKAIEFNPRRADFYWERGKSHHQAADAGQAIGSYERAIADYCQAIDLDPQRADFYWERGKSYHQAANAGQAIGSHEQAIADYSKAIELSPRRAGFFWERGKSYHQAAIAGQTIGSYERAIADHSKAIEFNPRRADFYLERGKSFHQAAIAGQAIGSYERAIVDYSKAIEFNPRHADFYWERGKSYHQAADAGQAIGSYVRAIADKSQAVDLDLRRSTSATRAVGAITRRRMRARPSAPSSGRLRTTAKPSNSIPSGPTSTGNMVAAITKRRTRVRPSTPSSGRLRTRAKALSSTPGVLISTGSAARAITSRRVRSRPQAPAEAIVFYERAIADYGKAIELDPQRADFYYSRNLAYRAAGKHSLADADLGRARKLGYKD